MIFYNLEKKVFSFTLVLIEFQSSIIRVDFNGLDSSNSDQEDADENDCKQFCVNDFSCVSYFVIPDSTEPACYLLYENFPPGDTTVYRAYVKIINGVPQYEIEIPIGFNRKQHLNK